ncbi:MarR family winged helix-turn-helix transcriptional regulator [Nocardia cyriacigeorgica]|uniref:Putative regulatory protein, MarR n=1 Tax=Nocardia cyriacigeorgica (strain GUH-2) TaxID=1127134 RepID=H6R510_NOCCG|nr:MarR family transcriptional regulator [Nocardia cyriacigeorgica]MBF6285118.1 MarR family transcriptional regulator [Nocardia cyriacigeorgica]BDT89529.1 MarR family transcriptional regulator [Nocardia cyriacigeorgica]CCF65834.1 putative regulatory protein, MarR [Nocardia cyriacigeorgica GUH-2]
MGPNADAVDQMIEAWRAERPDVDLTSFGVVARVARLARLWDAEVQRFLAEYDLDAGEADVLTTLRRAGKPYELTAGALVRSSMVTTGAITKRIDRMVDKGLVSRVPSAADRRTVLIRLSSRGKQILDDLFADHIANYERLLAALDRGQSEQLAGTLRILLCAMGDTSLT